MPDWKTKKRIMRTFKIGEISGVTRGAQAGALAIFTKIDREDDPAELVFAKIGFAEALDGRMMDQRFARVFHDAFGGVWQHNEAFQEALRDGYASSEETVRQYVESIADLARNAAEAVSGLAKSSTPNPTIEKAVSDAVDQFLENLQENEMPKFTTKAALKAAIATFARDGGTDEMITAIKSSAIDLGAESELPDTGALAIAKDDPLIAAMQKQIAVLSLSGDVRKHFDGLASADQDAFIALDYTGRAAAIAKAADDAAGDPVLYTTKAGIPIHKSDGKTALILAKSMDAQADQIAGLIAKADVNEFEKVARDEFKHLPTEGTALLLKMADQEKDPEKKKKMMEAMRAANKTASKSFQTIGGDRSDLSKSSESGDAEAQLDEMAKDYAKANNVEFHKAYSKVLETDEGAQLYAEFAAG